ncbi:MAG: VIT1/CCC1 transporter family protein [Actinobacteria bacterium]|nr:VIT1/CCC1 transporter family protein [Actinomycetota bacterium]
MALDRSETLEYEPHIGEIRQYWRDIILGVNDGLVSVFLLVVGVVGGGLTTDQVLLTGIAGALAGAVSMAAGEYLATKSQDEVFNAELDLERIHIEHFRDEEMAQLRGFFREMGVAPQDLDAVLSGFSNNDKALLNAMAALEFGVVESERRSPYWAMTASGLLFLLGSVPAVLPFALFATNAPALAWASVLTLASLFAVGVIKANVARTGKIRSGAENMVIAGLGGLAAWMLGDLVGRGLA